MNDIKCGRCGMVYNRFLGDRFWFGRYTEVADDGTEATYETLCDRCHRTVVRRS